MKASNSSLLIHSVDICIVIYIFIKYPQTNSIRYKKSK